MATDRSVAAGPVYVVGVDGSRTASIAADRAGTLAQALGGRVHVVCAYSDPRPSGTIVSAQPGRSAALDAERIAEEQAATYRSAGANATWAVGEGEPGAVLVAEAERVGADVIVVGNRRMQGIGRLLGSIANEVAHHAPCDVLIVKTV